MAFFVASQGGYAKNFKTYPSGVCSFYPWGKLLASLGFHALLPVCLAKLYRSPEKLTLGLRSTLSS